MQVYEKDMIERAMFVIKNKRHSTNPKWKQQKAPVWLNNAKYKQMEETVQIKELQLPSIFNEGREVAVIDMDTHSML